VLQTVDTGRRTLAEYESIAGEQAVEELRALARPLRGARVLQINATPYGGGVSELLRSLVPLERDLGLVTDWTVISGDEAFFTVTKALHNGLQGAPISLPPDRREQYLAVSRANARQLDGEYDVIVVHDPQPAALLELGGKGRARWIWRCHIDTRAPHVETWNFLRPFVAGYDAAVFTLPEFVPPDLPIARRAIVPPAIDPLSPKNMPVDETLTERVLSWIGVSGDRPLVAQISRFDPWKDPMGAIAAYRQARQSIPRLQLALVGSLALDDPEGWEVYRQIQDAARQDPQIDVFTNLTGVSNLEVNAFQRRAAVVIQKSIREGFGLVISEALWKGTPVVAGRAGGIPLQMPEGTGGFLIETVEECAQRMVELIRDRELARSLAERGREHVRRYFLLPRLLADELRLFGALLGSAPLAVKQWEQEAALGSRDVVCGMPIAVHEGAQSAEFESRQYFFCSDWCRARFEAEPSLYLGALLPKRTAP